jgi:hypothetical protein
LVEREKEFEAMSSPEVETREVKSPVFAKDASKERGTVVSDWVKAEVKELVGG